MLTVSKHEGEQTSTPFPPDLKHAIGGEAEDDRVEHENGRPDGSRVCEKHDGQVVATRTAIKASDVQGRAGLKSPGSGRAFGGQGSSGWKARPYGRARAGPGSGSG